MNYSWVNKDNILGLKLHHLKTKDDAVDSQQVLLTRLPSCQEGTENRLHLQKLNRIVNVLFISRAKAAENVILAFTLSATNDKARCSSDSSVVVIDMWPKSQN